MVNGPIWAPPSRFRPACRDAELQKFTNINRLKPIGCHLIRIFLKKALAGLCDYP